ncbi:lysophospholipid acyltransferase family protein [Peptococcaceae bacterium 1198_IL3148]
MFRTVIWFIYFVLYMLYSLGPLLRVNRLIKTNQYQLAEQRTTKIATHWAKSLIKLTGSTVEIHGLENIPQRNVLFISNHQGNFDIPLLIGYINKPKGFIAKVELKKLPIVNLWMDKINCVFMDRSNVRQSMKAIQKGIEHLKNGKSMVLFPEGTRSKGPTMGQFKPGSMKLALKSQVPIVPVTINGSYKILEQNGFIMKPTHVKIVVGEPIYVYNLSKEEQAGLSTIIRDKIAANLQHDL